MSNFYCGTSGFAYATWKPGFYPDKLAAAKFLPYYAQQLTSTESNFTFRRLATASVLAKWIDQTPENFRFAVKAHQRITHFTRLDPESDFIPVFLNSLNPLGARRGPVLFQLPPNMKADPGKLDAFLDRLPRIPVTFEFRHESWFDQATYSVLEKHNATLCWAESDSITTPEQRTANFVYMRLRKSPYGEERLNEIAKRIVEELQNGDVYVYLKHEESPQGALDAVKLRELVKT